MFGYDVVDVEHFRGVNTTGVLATITIPLVNALAAEFDFLHRHPVIALQQEHTWDMQCIVYGAHGALVFAGWSVDGVFNPLLAVIHAKITIVGVDHLRMVLKEE